jgi:RNA polymerase sigma-70 factor (ECF subfamily)
MCEQEWLETQFEGCREHLRKQAFRMLGSAAEVDDAMQEAWVRLTRCDARNIENLRGWLTTVVARVCLDMLRSRRSRREEPLEGGREAPLERGGERAASDPEGDLIQADSIGTALLLVLDTLEPAERVALVLHDMFDVPFDEIAAIVGRSEPATRKLASRARLRVRGGGQPDASRERKREVVNAFLAASRDGDVAGLLALLAPDVVLRADEDAVRVAAANRWGGAPDLAAEVRGADAVAETFKGRARGATNALIDGQPGAVWAVGGKTRAAFVFTVEQGRIVEIELAMDPARVGDLDIELHA